MLKFEGLPIGSHIRAHDFEPCEGRDDLFVEGVIFGEYNDHYKGYEIRVTHDSACDLNGRNRPTKYSRVGKVVIVPMEVFWLDYDGRIIDLTEAD